MSKNLEDFMEQKSKIENIFFNFMKKNGYSIFSDNNYIMAATKEEDKFVPFFELYEWNYPRSYSIYVKDRNGNIILTGENAAIYSLNIKDDHETNVLSDDEIKLLFIKMLEDIYEKYGNYSKTNRLDFSFNELATDIKDYPEKEIDKNSHEDIER